MAVDIATLGLKIDSSEVTPAATKLDNLTKAGEKAEAATSRLKVSTTSATGELQKQTQATQAQSTQMDRLSLVAERAIQRSQAAQTAATRANSTLGGQSGSRAAVARAAQQMGGGATAAAAQDIAGATKTVEAAVAELDARTTGPLNRFKQAALGAFDTVRDFVSGNGTRFRGLFGAGGAETIVKEGAAIEEAGHKAAVSSVAVREIITLAREAGRGDFTRMAGSASILAQSFGILRSGSLLVVAGIASIVGAAALLVVAYAEGATASNRFNNQLRLSGNYAGLTETSYINMAKAIGDATHTSVSSNEQLISSLARTNDFTSGQIAALVRASQQLSNATGEGADEIVADFARMAEGPTAYAEAYQRAHIGVISPVHMAHIRELEERGQKEQALSILIQDVTNNIATNAQENVGIIISAWRGATNALSDFWHQLTQIGRASTTVERIQDLNRQISLHPAGTAGTIIDFTHNPFSPTTTSRDQLVQQRDALVQSLNAENAATAAQTQHNRVVRDGDTAASHYADTYVSLTDNTARYRSAVTDLDTTLARMRANNDPGYAAAAAHRPQTLVALRRQYEPQAVRADTRAQSAAEAAARREARTAETRAVSLSNVNAELDKQIHLLGMVGPERERQQRYDQIDQSMLQRRIHLTPTETTQIQAKIASIQALTAVQAQLDRIYQDSVTPQTTYNATVQAAFQLFGDGTITLTQFTRQLGEAQNALEHATNPLLDFNRGFQDEADNMRFENSLLGMNAEQRAVANAQREIDIRLRDQARTGILADTTAISGETAALLEQAQARGHLQLNADNAREVADHMKGMNDAIRQSTANFRDLFGTAGEGFANLVNSVLDYRDTQLDAEARVAEARAQYGADSVEANRVQRQASEELSRAQVNQYGDMLGAAKSFFKEGSTGWKILEGAERAYRLVQFAMAVKAMLFDSVHTAQSVANSGVRAAADGVAAFAKTLASLPFPFNLVAGAVVLAALIAVGVKIAGGGKKAPPASAAAVPATYTGPVDEYGQPTSSYSVLKPGRTTVANDNGGISPNSGSASPGAGSGGYSIQFGDTNLTVQGTADVDTVKQMQAVLEDHRRQTVEDARQAVAADQAARAGRQKIGGAI